MLAYPNRRRETIKIDGKQVFIDATYLLSKDLTVTSFVRMVTSGPGYQVSLTLYSNRKISLVSTVVCV